MTTDISEDIRPFRVALGFQILASLFGIAMRRSLAPIINNLKIGLEVLVVWYFLEPTTDHFSFLFMAIVWSLWECVVKFNLLSSFRVRDLYYNMFVVLHPVVAYSMLRIINDFHARHQPALSSGEKAFIWGVYLALLAYKVYSYARHWNTRIRHYEEENRPKPAAD